jgi:hypothetical protein
MRESVPFGVRMSVLRPAFIVASIAWAALLPIGPLVASRPHVSSAGAAFVVAIYGIGSLICHQLPARSYRLWAVQMPVCARCTGIYVGAAVSAILVAAFRRGRPWSARGRSKLRPYEARVAVTLAAAPTLLTLVYEWTTGATPANWIRAAAGVPIGAVISWLVVRHADHERSDHPEPVEG